MTGKEITRRDAGIILSVAGAALATVPTRSAAALLRASSVAGGGKFLPAMSEYESEGDNEIGTDVFYPEMFGAAGDGVSNDTLALQKAASALMSAGGGRLRLRRGAIYIVGKQDRSDVTSWAFAPTDVLRFDGLTGRIKIEGNGATLKCEPGLKFGAFNADGTVYGTLGTDLTKRASPYQGMIHAEGWPNGEIEAENLTLDGNIQNLEIGGNWGDTGWQIKCAGIQVLDSGTLTLKNVRSINHGTDGMTYSAVVTDYRTSRRVTVAAENCAFEHNGRLGIAVTGGRGGVFRNCSFSYTGVNGVVASNPMAGVDMEPEGGNRCLDFDFHSCRFLANINNGYVSDFLESTRRINFYDCTFSGDFTWSHWIRSNQHTFHRCHILGNFIDVSEDDFSADGRGLATCYLDCTFAGDPTRSPTGKLYGQGIGYVGGSGPTGTAHFDRCVFDYPAKDMWISVLQDLTTFRDCEFRLGRNGTYPVTGRLYGTNVIVGLGKITPSAIYGQLIKRSS